jgi:hypothetical protein
LVIALKRRKLKKYLDLAAQNGTFTVALAIEGSNREQTTLFLPECL